MFERETGAWVHRFGPAKIAVMPRVVSACALAVLLASASTAAQPATASKPAAAKPATQKPATPAKPRAKAAGSAQPLPETPEFKKAASGAAQAREANRLDEAVELYTEAVRLKPDWSEGWWYLGTLSYELDRHEQARDAFRRLLARNDQDPAATAFLGLSEFALKSYDASLANLLRARTLGIGKHKDLAPVVRYHAAIQLTRMAQYDQSLQLLTEFAVEGNDNLRVIEAFGIAVLRLPMLPDELPPARREPVMMAGRAQYFTAARMLPAARQSFEQLVARYPDTPSVHYAYGVFLLAEEPDLGITYLTRELAITPGDVWSMLQLAFEYLKRSDFEQARTWAERAVTADPVSFVARHCLGQALLELGDVAGAIEQLERGARIAPDSPAVRFQLAKAYQKAGRTADAERERAEFVRLDRAVRTNRSGSQAVGGFQPGVEQHR